MTLAQKWKAAPFWSLYKRGKKTGFPTEELLSVYRDYGVIKKSDRDDNWNRPGEDLSAYQLVDAGDLVLNKMKTWQGSLGVSQHRGIVSPAYFVYKPQSQNDSRFMHYALRSDHYIKVYASISKGVRPNQWDLQPEQLDAMHVLVPDLTTQQRIADYLDREVGEIDDMMAKMDELAGQLEERRDAVILRELQDIPGRAQLTLTVDVISGSGFPDKYQGASTNELPFYKVGSMSSAVNGYLGEDENSVSRSTAAELGARVIPPGSILMAKIGAALMLARFVQTTKSACIDNNMQALVPRDGVVDPRFLAYAMTEVSIPSLVKNGPVPTVDVMGMKMTHIACPSTLDEQKRIADHLNDVTGKIDAMLAKVAELKSLLTERRAALITDVVTGRKELA
ncbi:hypothetical protein [Arthrobacter sp. ISL-95]|uniref:hypothetical protein n=1 Tax=Arthrobacter sp. ISL-95 TaxID=2819116 RepID=UPI001BEAA097|nr:hypothetical protein [Arthrobacter sp. ISL-95]MBT2588493.1 hypothetical protein [Arthrobacter sp. ISL-95]